MQVPPEITFKDVEKTAYIEELINRKIAKLEQVCNYIISCRVVVEQPHKHQRTGNPYRVRIDMKVPPDHELVAKRISPEGEREEPLPATLRRAFSAMERQLIELVERQRAEVKKHPETEVSALVEKLFQEDGYGFLRTLDGRQVYFHRNSVPHHGEFERLEVGTGVRFSEEMGENGPQATTIEIENKPVKR